jgi:hypothetical protein
MDHAFVATAKKPLRDPYQRRSDVLPKRCDERSFVDLFPTY